ncbi:SIR2 family protein [Pedobacter sp. Leaf132]|uniref:SIR2 family NAD-dependent protein deacylase n=1 Tax=Pedobacter sp. Leaf132 TaxID=2876557 RepID=UPI001E2844F5|nr:SIR2 family protein [Pedobacter sp. Leaf132]
MTPKEYKNKEEVFDLIAESSIYGNLGLFIGAGLPMAILNDAFTTVALSWPKLIEECCKNLKVDYNKINKAGSSYPEIATELCKVYAIENSIDYQQAVKKLKEKIADITSWYPEKGKRKEYAEYFESINPKWVITTNYDTIIESILTGKGYSLSPSDYMVSQSDQIPVYHLHGLRTNPDSIIITQEDYISLFRPNEYRQQKLPLTIKESLTVLIGYNLGDFNVLTAVDWSKNVYSDKNVLYPQGIIQFLYCQSPKTTPYLTQNGIIIIEFNDLSSLLAELKMKIDSNVDEYQSLMADYRQFNQELLEAEDLDIVRFIDDDVHREDILKIFKDNDIMVISGLLEIYVRAIQKTWDRSGPSGAFHAYDENLKVTIDILINVELKRMPPALLESAAYNLNSVAYYVGDHIGKSHAAWQRWNKDRAKISEDTIKELMNISISRRYHNLKELLQNNRVV